MPEYIFYNLTEENAAGEIWRVIKDKRYILLTGELGSGKTTLVRGITRLLGIPDIVSSPTFSIHNTYSAEGIRILHTDLYRLRSVTELEQTGFFELLEFSDYAFIEWADLFNIKDMLKKYAEVNIIKNGETARQYEVGVT
ncbi:MAG: tRNA (adenosine(37)-N6)-threonylcarbamoyltransferase complex ATPase subunit type 1 TsaE [Deferribacteraceae bacterium]|jgi:tRNA threonylcarbamoyladenosine biosynthesis protein TsaE|nr:tRNA (adenosine(37)-N6)-threonylcarbamoyltransferase complex ATPase subunit type 1 TsaE [Deferribacteraceae bacterium]